MELEEIRTKEDAAEYKYGWIKDHHSDTWNQVREMCKKAFLEGADWQASQPSEPSREAELEKCLGELVAIGREREFDPIGHKIAVDKAKALLNIK